VSCCKDSTLLQFLGPGRFGLSGTSVFEGAIPDMARALTMDSEERKLWSIAVAGARGISFLTAPTSVV
jgi:hypothetical protein